MMKVMLEPSFCPLRGDNIIVIMDAKHGKESIDALNWAIDNVVRPKDKLVVLGVLSEVGKKIYSSSCFPFRVGIVSKTRRLNLDFPNVIKEEIDKKREEYQRILQPYYRHCKKIEVNLDFTLAAGYDPRQITIEEAHKLNPRWIVLDSFLKKEKVYIYGHVDCNIAVMKRKGLATLMPLRTPEHNEQWRNNEYQGPKETEQKTEETEEEDEESSDQEEDEECCDLQLPPPTPNSPCWRPLAWRMGFPRTLSIEEIENMTNGYSDENIDSACDCHRVYKGIFLGTPVIIKCYPKDNGEIRSLLEIISQVRHHSILGLIGHCCTDESMFLVNDYPCSYTLEMNLLDDESSKRIPWEMRWNVALEIGGGLRYLQEECENGPIVDVSISSSQVVIFHGSSAMLCIVNRARLLKEGDSDTAHNHDSSIKCGEDNIQSQHILADIRGYGKFLIELITGKTTKYLQEQDGHPSSFDWAIPFLEEENALREMMDKRLFAEDSSDVRLVQNMAKAALLCLKSDLDDMLTMTKVLAVVRGDQDGTTVLSL